MAISSQILLRNFSILQIELKKEAEYGFKDFYAFWSFVGFFVWGWAVQEQARRGREKWRGWGWKGELANL